MSHARGRQDAETSSVPPSIEDTEDRDWPLAWASLAVSLVVYVALASAIALFIPSDPETLQAAAVRSLGLLPEPARFVRPEPLEKARYLLGLGCIALLPLGFFMLLSRLVPAGVRVLLDRPRSLTVRDGMLVAGLTAWFVLLASQSGIPNVAPLLLVAFAIASLLVARASSLPRLSGWVSWSMIVAVGGLGFVTQILGDNWFFYRDNIWHHIDIILGAVNQVAHGRTVLVDTSSQYGVLYPYAAAALTPGGVSLRGVTVFFATLVSLQFVFLLAAVSRFPGMTNGWRAAFTLAYAGLAAPMLGSAMFLARETLFLSGIRTADIQPVYYQFTPIRTIFFALFAWLLAVWGDRLGRRGATAGYLLAATAFLWNADTGLVILVAWAGMLVYRGLAACRLAPIQSLMLVARHIAAATATFAVANAAYAVFAFVRCGRWPDFAGLFRFQKIFYQAGFFMLPMPLWELWQPVFALHALTIAWCLRQAVYGQVPSGAAWKFFVAAYGLGSFSYYQGRSMTGFLPSTFLPALLLAFMWAHESLSVLVLHPLAQIRRDPRLRLAAIATVPLVTFLVAGSLNFIRSLPAAAAYACDLRGPLDARQMEPLWQALRPHVADRAVVFLTDPSGYFHTKTSSWSALSVANLAEVFLESQLAEIRQTIDEPGMVVVVQPDLMPAWGKRLDLSGHQLVAELPNGFQVLRAKPGATGASLP
jgi:hypothetical protein